MKRNIGVVLGTLGFGMLLGVAGCDSGGGIDSGMPDVKNMPAVEPPKEFKVNAAEGPKMPTGGAAPKVETPPPVEKK